MKALILGLLMGLWTPVAAAQAAQADEADDIRQTVLRFYTALDQGSAEGLRAAIWAPSSSPVQVAGREEIINLILAHKRLEQVAMARWAEEGKRLRNGLEMLTGDMNRKALEGARIERDEGNKARIHCAGETGDLRMIRINGRWQIWLDAIEREFDDEAAMMPGRPDNIVRIRLDRLRMMSRGIGDVAQRIEAGEYASASDAETAVLGKWTEVAAEVTRRRTAMWERRFAR